MRNIITITVLTSLFLAAGIASAAEYEFYKGCQYPGKGLRPGVGVNKVIQPGGEPQEYSPRTVQWWPRKGHDIVEIEEGMPLRKWTFGDSNQILSDYGTVEAHLIGFRGVGTLPNNPPFVVLRLPDGRKRMFPAGSFGGEDRKFIIEVYEKELKRMKANSSKVKYTIRKDLEKSHPNIAKPGEPGTMQVETEHIVWASGSQSGDPNEPWIREANLAEGKRYRDEVMQWSENMWGLYEYSGNLMCGWDREEQHKYLITVPGTKRDGFKVIGGYAGGGYGGCGIKGASIGLLAHEWGHGIRMNSSYVGGGEAGADTCSTFAMPRPRGNHHTRRPERHVFGGMGGYGVTTFYNVMGDNPNWGHAWFCAMPYGHEDAGHTLLTIARVGEQRGLFDQGIRGLGDLLGEYAARVATFDCELEYTYSRAMFTPIRHWMEPVDLQRRIYRITSDYAPEPWGVNIVRLVPDKGAKEITVNFHGIHDPEAYSDWRACIVSLGSDGVRRYSPFWNKGPMKADVKPDDASHWLTVAATPTAMYLSKGNAKRNIGVFCSGRHAWRYPWMAQFTGARPGSPHRAVGDLTAKGPGRGGLIPAVPGTYAADYLQGEVERFTTLSENATEDRVKNGAKRDADHIKGQLESMARGKRHPNGGGWVQDSAKVDATAYVGPNAMVLDNAQVLGNASIEDFAVVRGSAIVKDNARIFGAATVEGNEVVFSGYSRTWLGNRAGSAPEKSSRGVKGEQPVVPLRPGTDQLRPDGLWINYAMDAPSNISLEDFYRYRADVSHGHNRALVPVNNGYLRGKPEFAEVDGRAGLRFDGKKQYAEVNPRAIDLGEATIVATVRRESNTAGVLFDFGTSKDNCMVLRFEQDGTPVLEATVGGKSVLKLQGKKSVPVDSWATLRVELDGKVASLWLDKEVVAKADSSFRPADVFPSEAQRRNTLAIARDRTGGFQGMFDALVIYHQVNPDFEKVPTPPTDAPTRPTTSVVKRIQKEMGDAQEIAERIRNMVREELAPLEAMKRACEARQNELLSRDEGLKKAKQVLAAAQAEGADTKKLNDLAKKVNDAEEAAWQQYGQERGWLKSFAYAGFGGHYNMPYRYYIEQRAKAIVGGGEMRENAGMVVDAQEAYADPANWRTEVDWDWRMPEEIDGRIDKLPLMKAWLEHTRGPVVKEKPTGAK